MTRTNQFRKEFVDSCTMIGSSIITAIVFYLALINSWPYQQKLLWIIVFVSIYLAFLAASILFLVLFYTASHYYGGYKDFLKRLIPGIAGGVIVFTVTQFMARLPNNPNIVDTVIPNILWTVADVFLVFIILFSLYLVVALTKKRNTKIRRKPLYPARSTGTSN